MHSASRSAAALEDQVRLEPLADAQAIAMHSASQQVAGVPLEVVRQEFADRTLVLVTQLGKVGYLVQARVQTGQHADAMGDAMPNGDASAAAPDLSASVVQTPLFGTPPADQHDVYSFYVAQIAARVAVQGTNKPVVVGLALKRTPGEQDAELDMSAERERFQATMALLEQCTSATSV